MADRNRRPRGRPRKQVTAAPARPVGRPRVDLLDDPERYLIALFFALTGALGIKERPASRLIAAFAFGKELPTGLESADFCMFAKRCQALPGGRFLQIEGTQKTRRLISRADALRAKARGRWSEEQGANGFSDREGSWLQHMALAFAVALSGRFEVAKPFAFSYAAAVGETEFAVSVIFPMIEVRTDFSDNFSPKTNTET